jgi:hypothetical protein
VALAPIIIIDLMGIKKPSIYDEKADDDDPFKGF